MEQVNTLVAGGGRIGEIHARNVFASTAGLRLAGIVEPHPSESLMRFAQQAGVRIVTDLSDALERSGDIDAVIVATPTALHEEVVNAAASVGAHVFCEKPLAGDVESARRIVSLMENAGKTLQVGFNRRFDHNFAALRNAVATGAVGRVELVRVTSRDPAPPGLEYIRTSGGLFMDMTIHDFDMVRFITADEVVSVFAKGACLVDERIGSAGDIDTAVVTLTFGNGAIGVIENSRRATYGYDQRAAVHGSGGAAETGNDVKSSVVVSDATGVHGETPLHFFLERYRDSFVAELESFAAAVGNGSPPEVSGRDGIEAMRIADACRVSLSDGCEVSIPEEGQAGTRATTPAGSGAGANR